MSGRHDERVGNLRKCKRPTSDKDEYTEEEFDKYLNIGSYSPPYKTPFVSRQTQSHVLESVSCGDGHRHGSITLEPGKAVELRNGTLLYITRLFTADQGTMLRGRPLVLQNHCSPFLPKCKGEAVWRVDVYTQPGTVPREIQQRNVDVREVKGTRKIIFTNANFPTISRRLPPPGTHGDTLYCRRMLVRTDPNGDVVAEMAIENLTREQAFLLGAASANTLRTEWRGTTALNGSHLPGLDPRGNPIVARPINGGEHGEDAAQGYTMGDCFCGAGGVSRGARQAGLVVKFGFDIDEAAIASYRANFTRDGTVGLRLDVSKFLEIAGPVFRVDVAHASPPCQPFSAAHTKSHNMLKDEQNQAVLFSIWQLTERLRPRIMTVEETEGLYCRHQSFFHGLVHTFIAHGYSVRWRIINACDYGVPQNRRRLYLFAAGPGEKLPPFPHPTHGVEGSGLEPVRTIADAIYNIPRDASHHNVPTPFRNGPKPAYDPNQPALTLTCGSGANYHPSGKRGYTAREMAALQTFPHDHSFANGTKTAAGRQIGNAVPPRLAEVFLRACVQSLKASDSAEMGKSNASYDTSPTTADALKESSPPSPSPRHSGSGNSIHDCILIG